MRLTDLTKMNRAELANIKVDAAIATAYPIKIVPESPGSWGHSGDFRISKKGLHIPEGIYSSRKHYHRNSARVVAVETARRKLNVAPLFLLEGRAWNGDYRYMKTTCYLFSQNEDRTYFLHKVRPNVGESLTTARAWMWELRDAEHIARRQGDLAFIPKARGYGAIAEDSEIRIGNHIVNADTLKQTKHRIYALNPRAEHAEHDAVDTLTGWYELRLARAWTLSGRGD